MKKYIPPCAVFFALPAQVCAGFELKHKLVGVITSTSLKASVVTKPLNKQDDWIMH